MPEQVNKLIDVTHTHEATTSPHPTTTVTPAPPQLPNPTAVTLLPTPRNIRPGRSSLRHTPDIDLHASYGDSIYERDPSSIRVFFQNVKGLTYSTTGEDYAYYLSCTASIGADIIGMAETNTAWSHYHLRQSLHQQSRKQYQQHKISFSFPIPDIDPVPETETFQAGGTLTMALNSMVPMAFGESHQDPTGLGRWSSLTFRGQDERFLTVFTAYRVCKGSIQSSPIGSAFSREYEHHRGLGIKNPQPRKLLLNDLTNAIQDEQSRGHATLIMMDSNGSLHDDTDLQRFTSECELIDLHERAPSPSTYIGSSHRRIDHIFGCPQVQQSLQSAGSLSYIDGPQSDHRGLFVDLNPAQLLGRTKAPHAISPASSRSLKTGNPEAVETYTDAMLEYYDKHNMMQRLDKLVSTKDHMSIPTLRKHLEKWDADQGRAMKHAEDLLKRPTKPYEWSPKLRNDGLLYRYWHLRLREKTHSADYHHILRKIETQTQQHDPTFVLPFLDIPLPLSEIHKQLKLAQQNLKTSQNRSLDLRYRCYTDLLATYINDRDPSTQKESERKAKVVTNTIKSEQCRSMYANIRATVKPSSAGSLSRLLVPHHKQDKDIPHNFQDFLATTPADDIQWDSILDQASIERNLLRFNREHFRAAAASPCGHGKIHDQLTFSSLSDEAASLLDGNIPPDWHGSDELLREFLTSFIIPDHIKHLPKISTEITSQDVHCGFIKWKERTSTSPSGRHLGHYKALIQNEILLSALTKFLQLILDKGITLNRWCNAVNIMIEKDQGQPKVTRLRIIHLFEADLNFFLKIQWGSRLVRHAEKHSLLNDGQHGSVPRRTAMDPIMLTELTTDLCRTLKHNLARFDNDASACYDRIIVALGMLAARRCGMPTNAISTHASVLQHMKYTVKTIHGISDDNYQGTHDSPLFGTGQGSGASPAVWLTLVVTLMNTLDRVTQQRMTFQSPDSDSIHTRLVDAFVDDTSLGFTDTGTHTLSSLTETLSTIAQTWEKLLFFSGGSLNLQKCSWYVMHWTWVKGRPHLAPIRSTDSELRLSTQGNDAALTTIKRMPLNKANRLLGVYLSPDGDFATQLMVLKKKADEFAHSLRSPRLTPQDVITFHRTTYGPSMRYVLPAISVDEEELSQVQSKILSAILNKLGHSSKLSTEIRHGPIELGGLDLIDLRTEVGISQLKYMRDAIYSESEAGKLITMSLKYSQIEAGIAEPLLEHPHIRISYLTPTWLLSIRQYLYQHNLTVSITDVLQIHLRSRFDQFIMSSPSLANYTPSQQRDLNLVRLHLQVTTLSDMTEPDGLHVCTHHLQGQRRPEQQLNHLKWWPRQETVTPSQTKLWTRYISSSFLRYGKKWRQSQTSTTPAEDDQVCAPTQYPTIHAYLLSLPIWYRRLLNHCDQVATDLTIWRSFRSKRRLIIASDGSLLPTAGTFGWKVTTDKHITLYQGSGPIDGPIDTGSSTRSELGGFTAPLLLITLIARHWGLRHRCKFRWIVDSQIAINRVIFTIRKDYRPTKQPDNTDYLSVIRELHHELRRPIRIQWIKSHQDHKTAYAKLSPDAKLNIDVDKLATQQHNRPRSKPAPTTAHIPATKMSITINKIRYAGNIDANLRFQINGGYLRQYLQRKHGWSDRTWDTINLPALGRHLKTLPLNQHTAHIKFIHDKQPLGIHQLRIAKIKDAAIALCPCCMKKQEDQQHLLHCQENPARKEALHHLLKTLTGTDAHPYGISIAACIEKYLLHSSEPIIIPLDTFATRYKDAITDAMECQQQIGWIQLLRGFLGISWLRLASMKPISNDEKPDMQRGNHRIHTAISAIHKYTRAIWLGRNEVLHKQKDTATAKKYSAESTEIRHYFSDPLLLPAEDRHYVSNNLDKLLRSSPSVRRRWLRRVRTARNNMLKKGLSQLTIRNFLTKPPQGIDRQQRGNHAQTHTTDTSLTSTPTTQPPTQPIERTPGRPPDTATATRNMTRTRTTQQRMTAFFPGRPPDNQETQLPGNPPRI